MSSEGQPAAEEPHGSLWLQLRRQWGGGREAQGRCWVRREDGSSSGSFLGAGAAAESGQMDSQLHLGGRVEASQPRGPGTGDWGPVRPRCRAAALPGPGSPVRRGGADAADETEKLHFHASLQKQPSDDEA